MKLNKVAVLVCGSLLLQGCVLDGDDESNKIGDIPTPVVPGLGDSASGYPVGAAIPAGDFHNSIFDRNDLMAVVEEHFSQFTAENIMKPVYIQPEEGRFEFDDANELLDYAQQIGATVHGHTLVWHSQVPEWMKEKCQSTDKSTCIEVMENHVTEVVTHFKANYPDQLVSWDVLNEAFYEDGTYRDTGKPGEEGSFWYEVIGEEYIQLAFEKARENDANVDLYYNDFNLSHNGPKLDAVINMIEEMKAANTPIDGLGFQMHIGLNHPEIEVIQAAFEKAQQTGLKVKITELDMRMNDIDDVTLTQLTPEMAEKQKQRYHDIIATYLEVVPAEQRGGFSVWGVSDADSWLPDFWGKPDWPLLFDEELNAKPALEGVSDAVLADNPDKNALFIDTFENGISWYKNESSASGDMTHNAEELVMDVNIAWSAVGDTFDIARTFNDGDTIDFNSAKTISFDVYVPSEYGALAIQPYIMDANYTPAFIGYNFSDKLGEWTTITISGIDKDFEFGWSGDPDFGNIERLGLQFISNGEVLPNNKLIKINNVKITR